MSTAQSPQGTGLKIATTRETPDNNSARIARAKAWLRRRRGLAISLLCAVLVILLVEIFVFNIRFWQSFSSPRALDPQSVRVTYSSGLQRSNSELFTVIDGQKSYVEVKPIDGYEFSDPIDMIHVVSTPQYTPDSSAELVGSSTDSDAKVAGERQWWVGVRVQVLPVGSNQWVTGEEQTYAPGVEASSYLKVDALNNPHQRVQALRLWFQAPLGSTFAFGSLRLNDRPPFSISPLRVSLLVFAALFIICFVDPRSAFYRRRYNPRSPAQLALICVGLAPLALAAIVVPILLGGANIGPVKPTIGNYTYEQDQYARLADALIHGHPWLDLPVPDQLAQARNPYSMALRAQMLSEGVAPVFWDHVFWGGRWYVYFGLLPALLFFVPFELLTMLFNGGQGYGLPATDAVLLTLFLLSVWCVLLVSRLIQRYFPRTSLGMALMLFFGVMTGSNLFFLLFKPDFYATPVALGVLLVFQGLWCWLSARRVVVGVRPGKRSWLARHVLPASLLLRLSPRDKLITRPWALSDGVYPPLVSSKVVRWHKPSRLPAACRTSSSASASSPRTSARTSPREFAAYAHLATSKRQAQALWSTHPELTITYVSRPHLVWGTLLLAANIGARPHLVATALLAFVIFWPEIRRGVFFSWLQANAWKKDGGKARQLRWQSLTNDASVILTGLLTFLPFLAYNYWRFGSFTDFGNKYQLTVIDLTTYKEPLNLLAPIMYYYLLIPVKFSAHFPFLGIAATPLSSWQYEEQWSGGLLWLIPFTLLALITLVAWRQLRAKHLVGLVSGLWLLGLLLCAFDSYYAGLSLRYLADFAWTFAFLAVLGALLAQAWARSLPDTPHHRFGLTKTRGLALVHSFVGLITLATFLLLLMMMLSPLRNSTLHDNASNLWFSVRALFVNGFTV